MLDVPAGAAGMEIRPIDTMGGREVNDVFFTDCALPVERADRRARATAGRSSWPASTSSG